MKENLIVLESDDGSRTLPAFDVETFQFLSLKVMGINEISRQGDRVRLTHGRYGCLPRNWTYGLENRLIVEQWQYQ